MTDNAALLLTLQVAVPLRIAELEAMPPKLRERLRTEWAREAVDVIAAQGDVLQYGGKHRGQAAGAFNHLARGLAAAAWQPGGVHFAGLHFAAPMLHLEGAA